MDNENFQIIVLNQLARLTQGMAELQGDVNVLQGDVGEIKGLRGDVDEIKGDISELRDSQVRMENVLDDKIRALFEAREVQNDVNKRIFERFDNLDKKLDQVLIARPYIVREEI